VGGRAGINPGAPRACGAGSACGLDAENKRPLQGQNWRLLRRSQLAELDQQDELELIQ
jgi:hypothetical protein